MMRARADAIMVGAGTWRSDDPELTCRIAGMERHSPVRVVVDRRLELAPSSRLLATIERAPLWLMAGAAADPARRRALERAGARVVVPSGETAGGLDAAAMLKALGDQGITRLLVEGGRRLAESLLAADLVDEAAIITAPHDIGRGGVRAPDPFAGPERDGLPRFVLVSSDRLGADTVRQYRRSR
jgi:diaminohydroxyphosphoribosylaminopyrimidine deaminase/5-amino-6-(5-phosphoribosylamino)uracil reductase